MQESNPVVPTPVPTNEVMENSQPRNNNLLVVLLSVFLFISIVAAGFFVYQNQKLVKELKVSKTATLKDTDYIPSGANETIVWETYSNEQNGYSIKFPKNNYIRLGCMDEWLTAVKYTTDIPTPLTMEACERDGRYNLLEVKAHETIQGEPEQTEYYDILQSDIQIDGVLGKLYTYSFTHIEEGLYPEWFIVAHVNKNDKTYEIYFSDKSNIDLFYDILSTFKFAV